MNNDENSPWQYKPGGSDNSDQDSIDSSDSTNSEGSDQSAPPKTLSWTAAEYVEHDRGIGWYVLLLLLTTAIAAGIYLGTKDYFAVGATVVAGIIVGIYAGRKPNQVTYELTNRGINIEQKSYSYSMFRSFSVLREGKVSSINFLPIKRLMPPIAAYFEPQNEQKVMEVIGDHLPFEEHKLDPIDRLVRRLRF